MEVGPTDKILEAGNMYTGDLPSIQGNAEVESVRRIPLGLCSQKRQCRCTNHNEEAGD